MSNTVSKMKLQELASTGIRLILFHLLYDVFKRRALKDGRLFCILEISNIY